MGNFTKKICLFLMLFVLGIAGSLSAQTTVFDDNFETGTLNPAKWTQSPAVAPVNWSVGSTLGQGISEITPRNGGGSNFVKLFSANYQAPVKLITSVVNLVGINEPIVDFWMASQKFAAGTRDTLKVYFRTSATEPWTFITQFIQQTNSWERKVLRIKNSTDFANAASIQVAFEWNYANAKGIALDDIRIAGEPVCLYVINMRAANITHQSAQLSWASSQYATSHTLKVSTIPLENPATDIADVYNNVTVTSTPYYAVGLDAETPYYWYVKSDCGDGDVTQWYEGKSFKTKCLPSVAGVIGTVYNFEGSDFGCWSKGVARTGAWTASDRTASADSVPAVVTTQSHTTSHSLQLFSYYAAADPVAKVLRSYAATPQLDITDITQYQVKFWARPSVAGARLHVGVISDVDDINTINEIVSFPMPTVAWAEYTVYLNGATNGGKAISFLIDANDIQVTERIYIDDVVVSLSPECAKPVFLSASNPTSSGATMTWIGTSPTYNIQVFTDASSVPDDIAPDYSFNGVTSPKTLTGLPPSTTFYVYVQGTCGSAWSNAAVFQTTQQPAVLPFTEDFEGPIKWDLVNSETNKWFVGTAVNHGGSRSLYISNNNGAANAYTVSSTTASYAFRLLNLTAGTTYEYGFDWRSDGANSNYDLARAFLVPNNVNIVAGNAYGMAGYTNTVPSGWIDISPLLQLQASWQTYTGITTVPSSGLYKLVFFWKNDNYGGTNPPAAIDNVFFEERLCTTPEQLSYTSTTSSAVIVWAGTSPSYQVRVFANGGAIDPDVTTPLSDNTVSSPSITLTGLSSGTAYRAFVRGICAGGNSRWIEVLFGTDCVAIDQCVYNIALHHTTTSGWGANKISVYSNGTFVADYTLVSGLSDATFQVSVCPGVVSFAYSNTAYTGYQNYFEIYKEDELIFSKPNNNQSFATTTFDYAAESCYSECDKPMNITVANADVSASVTWVSTADSFTVELYEDVEGFDFNTATPLQQTTTAVTSVSFTGLTPSTAYIVYIQSHCNGVAAGSVWKHKAFSTSAPLVALPYFTDFETVAEDSKWSFSSNTGDNKWAIGTAAKNGGLRGLYISNTNGTTNAYNTNSTSYAYAYVNVPLTAGVEYTVGFNWKGQGEGSYDLGRAFLIPQSVNIANGADFGMTYTTNTTPTGWIDLGGNAATNLLSMQTNWQTVADKKVTVTTSGIYYFAFFWKNDGSAGTTPPIAIDNVSFLHIECDKVKDINVVPSDYSASVSWTGTSDTYTVRVYEVATGIDPDVTAPLVEQTVPTPSAFISGLSLNTNYIVYIQGNCDNNGNPLTSDWVSKTFKTVQFPVVALPLITGFETPADDATNSKWIISSSAGLTGTSMRWALGTGANNGGNNGLYVTNVADGNTNAYTINTTAYSFAYIPVLLTAGLEYNFSFDWRSAGQVNNDLARAFLIPNTVTTLSGTTTVMANGQSGTNNNVPTGWTDIGGSAATNLLQGQPTNWQHVAKVVAAPASGVYYIAFFWKNNNSTGTQPPAAIDNISFEPVPCTRPYNITVSAADVTATASWTGNSESYTVKLYTGTTANPDAPTPVPFDEQTVTSPTVSFTGLSGNTDYIVYIQGNCDNAGSPITSYWGSKTFKTSYAIAALPLIANFENTADDSKWVISSNTGSNKWAIGSAAQAGGRSLYISNNNGVAYDYSNNSTSYSYAFVPLSLETGHDYTLSFDWKGQGESSFDLLRAFLIPQSANIANGADNGMSLSTNTTPTGWLDIGGNNAQNILNLQSNWQSVEKIVSVPANGIYYLAYFWKNDGSVGTPPPAAVDNVSFYEIHCPVVTDIAVTSITTDGARIEWTPSALSYDVKVSTTAINPETDPVGVDGYEINEYGGNYVDLTGLTIATQYFVYVRANCDNGYSSYYNPAPVLFSTSCDALGVPYPQHFVGFGSGSGVLPPCWSGTEFFSAPTVSGSIPYIVSGTGPTASSDGDNHSLRLDARRAGDDFSESYAVLPSFDVPLTGLQVMFSAKSTVAGSKLKLGVMSDPSASYSFEPIREYTLGTDWQTYVTMLNTEEAGVYGNLLTFMVSGDGEDVVAFTANIDNILIDYENDCLPPSNISYGNMSNGSVTIYWETPYTPNTRDFEVIVATVDVPVTDLGTLTPDQILAGTTALAADSATVSGLSLNTTYYYYVRMFCENNTFSDWYPTSKSFTVGTCWESDQCHFQLILHDTYSGNDGWNGNYLEVLQNGVSLGSATIESGYNMTTYNLNFCPSTLTFTYHADGSYTSENWYEIIREGETIYSTPSGSTPSTAPFVYLSSSCAPNPCDKPIQIAVTAADVYADISWLGSGVSYNVKVYQNSATIDPDVDTPLWEDNAVSATAVIATGLAANTQYLVFIQSNCTIEGNSTASYWASKSFTTSPALATLPINTGFENSTEDNMWIFSSNAGVNKWAIGSAINNGGGRALYVSNNNGAANAYTITSASNAYAYVPVMLDNATEYKVSFDWKSLGNDDFYDSGRAFLIPQSANLANGNANGMGGYALSTPANWIDIGGDAAQTALQNVSSWQSVQEKIVSVPTSGVYYLAFYWQNDGGWGTTPPLAIDNVSMIALPCSRPNLDFTIDDINLTVNAVWAGNADSYTVRLYADEADFDIETATPLINENTTATSYLFDTGLVINTPYRVYVRSECEGGLSSLWVSKTFKLLDKYLPLITGFEDNADNNLWRFSSNVGVNKWAIGSAEKLDGDKGLYISNDNGNNNNYDIYSTSFAYAYREYNFNSGIDYDLSFDWKGEGESSFDLLRAFLIPTSYEASIVAGSANGMTSSNNTPPSGWVALDNGILNLRTDWQHKEKTFRVPTSGGYFFAFFWKNDNSVGVQPPVAVDNVVLAIPEYLDVEDDICLGYGYEENHFNIPEEVITELGVGVHTDLPVLKTSYSEPTEGKKVLSLTLTVWPGNENIVQKTICEGDEEEFFGRQLARTRGEYTYEHFTYSESTGCDSVIRLELVVNPAYKDELGNSTPIIRTIYQSELPVWVGEELFGGEWFEPGRTNGHYDVYEHRFTTEGCDSTVHYSVTLTGENGLDVINARTFDLVPNPIEVGGSVEILAEFSAAERNGLKVEIIDAVGKVVGIIEPDHYPIKVSGFQVSGLYLVKVTTGTNVIHYGKVLVK
ncbi:MAG: fibronectin type III domain-containing protein [Prevotellaceae bacterium]|nr:fibronectin type III domain-containing protein [Prevotellaceae bacterium]